MLDGGIWLVSVHPLWSLRTITSSVLEQCASSDNTAWELSSTVWNRLYWFCWLTCRVNSQNAHTTLNTISLGSCLLLYSCYYSNQQELMYHWQLEFELFPRLHFLTREFTSINPIITWSTAIQDIIILLSCHRQIGISHVWLSGISVGSILSLQFMSNSADATQHSKTGNSYGREGIGRVDPRLDQYLEFIEHQW
jgi:uncharacterized membrane protein